MPELQRLVSTLVLTTVAVAAQDDAEARVQAWMRSDHTDQALLESAAKAVLQAGEPGLDLVARELATRDEADRRRRIAIDSLLSKVVLDFIEDAYDTRLFYAGQFDALRRLQPEVGRFLVSLIVDTPDWYPDDLRPTLVSALRDVYPAPPSPRVLDELAAIARNRELESEALRRELSFALAQWGRRELVEGRIEELIRNAGKRQSADELSFVRDLAYLYYQCRDFGEASRFWEDYLEGLRANEDEASVSDLYNAACAMSLAGRVEGALQAVETCAERLAERERHEVPDWLTAEFFDSDPDLRTIRSLPRFAAARKRAFGEVEPPPEREDEADPK